MAWATVALSLLLPGGASETARVLPSQTMQIPSALRQRPQAVDPGILPALRLFKQGLEAYRAESFESAQSLLPGDTDAGATAIADYVLLYRAKTNLMLGRDQEALEGFRALEQQFRDSSLIPDALLGQCQALMKLLDAASALSILGDPRLKKDSDTLYYQARALELAGQKAKAVELYLQHYATYPKAGFEALVQRNLAALSPSALRGTRSYRVRLQRSENLLRSNDIRGARQLLVALGAVTPPDSASSQKRSLLLGDVEYRLGKTAIALGHLRKVTAADPAMHAKALRLEGSCFRKSEKEQALIAQRDRVLKLYPRSGDTEELCYLVATYHDIHYEPAKAQEAYKILHERFPKGRYAERASWKLALYDYFQKEYGDAAAGFWRHLNAYRDPASAVPSIYWMARCYQRLGASENARYLYRRVQALANDSYFGLCARESESSLAKSGTTESDAIPGIVFGQVIEACDAVRLQAAVLPEPGISVLPALERARQLWSAELPDMAVSELRRAIQRSPGDEKPLSYVIAQIHASNEEYHRAIAGLRGIFPNYASMPIAALPDEIWQLLYPADHLEAVAAQAARNELDPFLIMGLIRQESAFNENARSSADARGLMQILPSTGARLARQARIPRYSAKKLFQAETNITLGTLYLSSLVKRYGKIELALAAYNAGGTRVDLWLKEFGDADMPEFVENIPFSETRGYIKQVLSNRALYSLLMSSGGPVNR